MIEDLEKPDENEEFMEEEEDDGEESPENGEGTEENIGDAFRHGLYEHHRLSVSEGQNLMRIDQWLTQHLKNSSRSRIKRASIAGCIMVNESPVKASYRVKPFDKISIYLPYPPPPDLVPEYVPLNIHYEDDEVILINKQAGLVVHPGVGNHHGTLVHGLLYYFNGPDISDIPEDKLIYPGLCHRIDKDTSGLLVVAKNEEALFKISRQFFHKTTERVYNAIVWRDVIEDKGTITGYIGRDPKDRKSFTMYDDPEKGKYSVTHYEVLERFGPATFVQCKLETGRTHQIRVHMKHIGHQLFGDQKYGGGIVLSGPTNNPSFRKLIIDALNTMKRQALHARTLGFVHPKTSKKMLFESELPADFQQLLQLLRNYAKSN